MTEPKTFKEFEDLPADERSALAEKGYRVPRTAFNGERRILIKLSKEDCGRVPGRGRAAFAEQPTDGTLVTDLITKKKYHYFLAPCSLPTCFCDAVVRPHKMKAS